MKPPASDTGGGTTSLPRAQATAAAHKPTARIRKEPPIARPPAPHTGPRPIARRGPTLRLPFSPCPARQLGNMFPCARNGFAHIGVLWYRGPVKIDVPSGARAVPSDQTRILRALTRGGGDVLYITRRDAGMEAWTLHSFRRAGFPLPDGARVQLWLKPRPDDDDDRWKEVCHARLLELSGLACAFDNEPTHVNAYKRAFPDARVVHLDTDHSGRPVEVRPDVPSIVDFR